MTEFETQDILFGLPLTCKQFVEEFNAISEDYVADTYQNYVDIYDAESGVSGGLMDPTGFGYKGYHKIKEMIIKQAG